MIHEHELNYFRAGSLNIPYHTGPDEEIEPDIIVTYDKKAFRFLHESYKKDVAAGLLTQKELGQLMCDALALFYNIEQRQLTPR